MLRNPNIEVLDTDAVMNPILRRLAAQRLGPDAHSERGEALARQALLGEYERARARGRWLVAVGLGLGPLTSCELGFVLQVPSNQIWRQNASR